MSYDIHVYPIELKEKTISENMNLDDVFEMSMTAGEFTYFGNLKGKFGVLTRQTKVGKNNSIKKNPYYKILIICIIHTF